jgi:hypothetical protein
MRGLAVPLKSAQLSWAQLGGRDPDERLHPPENRRKPRSCLPPHGQRSQQADGRLTARLGPGFGEVRGSE